MTRILLFVFALILLFAGGGAFVYFREAGAATEPQAAIDAAPAPGIFVPLDTISLPVFRDGQVRRLIAFTIVVEVAPGQDHERVSAQIPRFEDAFIAELTMLLGLNWPGDMALDLNVAKQRLLERSRRIAGASTVAAVLFRSVQERGS